MPKRKREESLEERLSGYEEDLYKALMLSKGFERQRLSKRVRDPKTTVDKGLRLQQEIKVLKALDLHKTAHTQLAFSLLRIKSIADSGVLPETFRNPVPDQVSAEDKAVLHNVTSGLCNHAEVRKVLEKALAGTSALLGLPSPEKKGRGKTGAGKAKEAQKNQGLRRGKQIEPVYDAVEVDEEDDVRGPIKEEPGEEMLDYNSEDDVAVEEAISAYDKFLGSSSDEEAHDEDKRGGAMLFGGLALEDDMSLSGSPSPKPSDELGSPSPPPAPKEGKSQSKTTKQAGALDSTFLPTLMGGYISGSESASDVDLAPSKKRLGQRQRQAKWERKYGESARHLQHEKGGGRDAGWDMKRGAVDGGTQGRKPSQGVKSHNKQRDSRKSEKTMEQKQRSRPSASKKLTNDGPLHPSWEAAKKGKESARPAAFQGKKIVFD